MNALIFLGTAVSTYYVMAIVQTLLHRVFGHRNRIRKIFVNHAMGHHAKYRKNTLLADNYVDSETHVMFYYLIPVAIIAIGVFLIGGPLLLPAYLLGVGVAFWLHLYLHEQYHLAHSPLRRFRWFRRKRELHFVHHRHVNRNYAIVEFWIDRLIGTLEEAPARQD
jgi:sterol desaturase/sphingolipid hydroxylase (fatty acid hydroxylase superfamily)